MSIDNKLDDSSQNLDVDTNQEQLDDSNTLHEQLKKIKEDSSTDTQESQDIDNPIYGYCS
jgi:hypothetical protein